MDMSPWPGFFKKQRGVKVRNKPSFNDKCWHRISHLFKRRGENPVSQEYSLNLNKISFRNK